MVLLSLFMTRGQGGPPKISMTMGAATAAIAPFIMSSNDGDSRGKRYARYSLEDDPFIMWATRRGGEGIFSAPSLSGVEFVYIIPNAYSPVGQLQGHEGPDFKLQTLATVHPCGCRQPVVNQG